MQRSTLSPNTKARRTYILQNFKDPFNDSKSRSNQGQTIAVQNVFQSFSNDQVYEDEEEEVEVNVQTLEQNRLVPLDNKWEQQSFSQPNYS
mmetsp:Transcript_2142/g.2042  ORF Transcript_2142/g.2042 Transcript_2142/m.2042 type:complete len:91 (-) Transcript_2142:155-427(-)